MRDLTDAYRRCEEITRTEARNFSYGIRLLPPAKRQAMSALYALARRIDDVGDGDLPVAEKEAALAALRQEVDAASVDDPDPVIACLADTVERYRVPVKAIHEIIDGCLQDCTGATYQTFDDTVAYCRLVAGSVGRLSLAVFGCDDPDGERRADALGVALQITNILRDIKEDREQMGRVYLPAEDIARFGANADLTGPTEAVAALVSFEAARAEDWYRDGLGLLGMLDRRSAACVGAMAGIYRRLLARIEKDPSAVMQTRVSLPGWEKGWVAVRSLAGVGA
ncbi:MAG TPA: presqualene diphosphate synthase HpnD [Acidimicrobiales bacterium]|nr:presqualene diphosphate synthase HpnD [Acidimicrobiales bacterium]